MNNQIIYKERKNTDCEKWDGMEASFGTNDLLPMWVADMDFQVPACVTTALQAYIEQGTFGYYHTPASYHEAFINWELTNHNYKIDPEWIRYAPGVVPAFNWWIQILTNPGDSVIILTPVYYPFSHAVKNNNRKLTTSPLKNENGVYTIDFEDFERKIIENQVKLFIHCSPHNPVGRVWKRAELEQLLVICRRHGVKVISDEIHQDLTFGNHKHIPTALIEGYDDMIVTLTAATKTFNLASCQNSFVIIPDQDLRTAFDRFVEGIRIFSGNAFGYIAVKSAYENGRPWLDNLLQVLEDNYTYIRDTLAAELPQAEVSPLEGTYLVWVNLKAYLPGKKVKEIVQDKARIAVDFGDWFGGAEYKTFIRFNIATSKENVISAMSELVKYVKEPSK